jgi:peptidoglycan hydrolase-like protein with peptidoglycan-binding domain
MNVFWAALIVCVSLAGCGKSPIANETAEVNLDSLTLQQADAVLAESAGATSVAVSSAVPPAQNTAVPSVVENKDAGPLVEAPETVAPENVAAAADAVIDETDAPDGEAIQRALKNLGLYTGAVDGKIGPKTKEAIREFQKKNGLTADGKVGPKTWALLQKAER